MRKWGFIWFLVYLIFGAYMVNYSVVFFDTPDLVEDYNKWIMLVGGILIVLGGINHFRLSLRHAHHVR